MWWRQSDSDAELEAAALSLSIFSLRACGRMADSGVCALLHGYKQRWRPDAGD